MACLKDDVEAALLHGRARDVVAVPQNLAVRGVRDAEKDVEQRGLAASGRSPSTETICPSSMARSMSSKTRWSAYVLPTCLSSGIEPPWSIGLLANARRGCAHTRVRRACVERAGECERVASHGRGRSRLQGPGSSPGLSCGKRGKAKLIILGVIYGAESRL